MSKKVGKASLLLCYSEWPSGVAPAEALNGHKTVRGCSNPDRAHQER